jgi:hypothetical protein
LQDGFLKHEDLVDLTVNEAREIKEILDVHVQISMIIAFCDGRLAV